METEMQNQMLAAIERLAGAAELLEKAAGQLAARETQLSASADATLERVVATAESDLALKLAAAEHRIAELEARAAHEPAVTGRKTVAASSSLAAKHAGTVDGLQAGALDAALVHLSLEQRIAVKAELLRAGFVG